MKHLIILSIVAVLTACAGTPFKWDDARQIKEGMTTNEVTALVGAPNNVTSQGDSLIYVWVYVSSFTGSRTLSVIFKDGKVTKAPPVPAEFQ